MRNKLVAIYLSLGPIIWFSSFLLGPVKRMLLFVIVFLFFIYREKRFRIKHSAFFLLMLMSFFITIMFQSKGFSEDLLNFFLGLLESYIFYVIGYNFVSQNILDDNRFVFLLLILPFFTSILTLTNFLFGFPNWVAPGQLEKYEEYYQFGYEMQKLWATGFSWGRNGWGCTLAVLLPFCFLIKKKPLLYTFWIVIFFSILLCGNRNGLLAATISFVIYYLISMKYGKKGSLFVAAVVVFLLLFVVFGVEFLKINLRLVDTDISAGRFDQYRQIPKMLGEMGFWGMGYNGTIQYMWSYGLGNHALHNTYLKLIIEFGAIIAVFLLIILISTIKIVNKAIRSRELFQIILSLVVLSGLLLALFEPAVLFGSLGGYASWWFVLGYLTNIQNNKIQIIKDETIIG